MSENDGRASGTMPSMRLLFIGDVVGRAGRAALLETLPELRRAWSLDCVIVNGENAAGGFGITETICKDFFAAGADCVTLGNHAFDQREAQVFITREPRLLRPANYPRGTPGRGATLVETPGGASVLVVNLMGRVFMDAMDDPFAAIERELDACPLGVGCDAAVVDFHGEASSEKQAFAHFVDGRVSLVVGTHTHVPTADHRILAHGTGYMTDAGMTGDYDSVIGMEKDEPIRRFTTKLPSSRFEPAVGTATLCGVAVELDPRGLAEKIAPIRIGGKIAQARPDFWLKAAEPVV
jgi:metallophosphoesterase (TIGR00282 family)